jgi:putative exporter of polyketide antibiotics
MKTSPSWEIVVGAAFLLAGAAVALVSSRKEFASLKELLNLYGRFVAYLGALLSYLGVLKELGANRHTLALVTLMALGILFLTILAAGIVQARLSEKDGVQEYPEPQDDGSQKAIGQVGCDEQGASAPE